MLAADKVNAIIERVPCLRLTVSHSVVTFLSSASMLLKKSSLFGSSDADGCVVV